MHVYLSAFLEVAGDLCVAVVGGGQLLQHLLSGVCLGGALLQGRELLVGGLENNKGEEKMWLQQRNGII